MKKITWKPLQILGILLVLAAAGVVLLGAVNSRRTKDIVLQLEQSLPQRFTGYEGIYTDAAMPVLQIGGEDFVGILDVPGFGVKLPVGGSWDSGKTGTWPCRFWGSAYDGSLVIGGSGQPGQLSFCEEIDMGDMLTFTDMTGAEFDYRVTWVERSESAQTQWLIQETCDLTVFARDPLSLEYIAVRCDLVMGSDPEEEAGPVTISPLPQTLDPSIHRDYTAAVSLEPGAITQENGIYHAQLTVYVHDVYDLADIGGMKEGDTLILRDQEIFVQTLETSPSGDLMINGGLDAGGCELRTDENTVWYEVGYSDVRSWYAIGTVKLPVSPEFRFTDYSDLDRGPENLTADQLSLHPQLSGGFTPHNTTAVIENGTVTHMYRVYTP